MRRGTLLSAGAASAGVSWVVRGHGFGHGVGMSQYGAYGYALHGKGYRFILRHYYTGTRSGKLQGRRVVRVLVDVLGGDVGFSGATGACGRRLSPGARIRGAPRGPAGEAPQLRGPGARRLRPQPARRPGGAGSDRRDRLIPRSARGRPHATPTSAR